MDRQLLTGGADIQDSITFYQMKSPRLGRRHTRMRRFGCVLSTA